jgi:hypothetical protein
LPTDRDPVSLPFDPDRLAGAPEHSKDVGDCPALALIVFNLDDVVLIAIRKNGAVYLDNVVKRKLAPTFAVNETIGLDTPELLGLEATPTVHRRSHALIIAASVDFETSAQVEGSEVLRAASVLDQRSRNLASYVRRPVRKVGNG